MTVATTSSIVSFPAGFDGGVEIDLELLCAAATEASIDIQRGDAEGLEDIYEHLGIPGNLRAEATRQIGVAFSMNRLFGESAVFLSAVDPKPETVERLAGHFESIAQYASDTAAPESLAQYHLKEIGMLQSQGRHASILPYLDISIRTSIRAGDIAAALACLKLLDEPGLRSADPVMDIRFAEYFARLGNRQRAYTHMGRIFSAMNGKTPLDELDTLLIASARTYLRIGALDGAGIMIDTIHDEELRFYLLLEKAGALMDFRRPDEARSSLLGECIDCARSVGDRVLRIGRLQAIIDTLIEHGMKGDAAAILGEITDELNNRSHEDHAHLAWAAQAMAHLNYPVEDIIYMLTEGWLREDHPDFRGDPTGFARRQSQAHLVRERWGGRLDHIADELLTA